MAIVRAKTRWHIPEIELEKADNKNPFSVHYKILTEDEVDEVGTLLKAYRKDSKNKEILMIKLKEKLLDWKNYIDEDGNDIPFSWGEVDSSEAAFKFSLLTWMIRASSNMPLFLGKGLKKPSVANSTELPANNVKKV